ncbi:MAG: hypothetical protein AB2992_04875 [Candidatus Symbiodolus clandestinus]
MLKSSEKVKTPKILKHLATTEFLPNPILYYLSFRVISYCQPVVMLALPKQDLYDGIIHLSKHQDFVLTNQWVAIELVNTSTSPPDLHLQIIAGLTAYLEKTEVHRNDHLQSPLESKNRIFENSAIQEQENENDSYSLDDHFQDISNLPSPFFPEQQKKFQDTLFLSSCDPDCNAWLSCYDPSIGLQEAIAHILYSIHLTEEAGYCSYDLAIRFSVNVLLPYADILIEHYKEYYQYIPKTAYIYSEEVMSLLKPRRQPTVGKFQASELNTALEVQESRIPNGFTEGTALGGGNCFFDSLAQGMNKLSIPGPGGLFTVKLLRQTCYEYAKNNSAAVYQTDKTWSQVISEDADGGGYVVYGNNESGNFDSYLVGIQLTTTQEVKGRSPIWGRPEIEGRMLCNKFGIKLHVVEKQTVEDEVITVHQLIDRTGSKSIDDSETATLYRNDKVLHILNEGRDHFVPILHSKVS